MNLKRELSKEQQELLKQADVIVKDQEYGKEEMRYVFNNVSSYIMNQSTKNGDMSKEIAKYNDIMQLLI